jgi:hypothetical protein
MPHRTALPRIDLRPCTESAVRVVSHRTLCWCTLSLCETIPSSWRRKVCQQAAEPEACPELAVAPVACLEPAVAPVACPEPAVELVADRERAAYRARAASHRRDTYRHHVRHRRLRHRLFPFFREEARFRAR